MKKTLTQMIVNTNGLARTVTQERDPITGRFTGKAQVSVLLNPSHVLHKAYQHEEVVVVHHGYTANQQTVTSVNRKTGRGNAVTFFNDGYAVGLHDSIYQN